MRRLWLREIAGMLILAGGLILRGSPPVDAQIALAPPVPVDTSNLPLLPWLPLIPGPRPVPPILPPGTPPFLPSPGQGASGWWPLEAGQSPVFGDLAHFIATLQQALDRLEHWVEFAQQLALGVLGRMIWESPGLLPQGAELQDLIGQIGLLPEELRGALEGVLAKLRAPVLPGTVEARHQTYIGSNPVLARKAAGIAETDEVVVGGAVQQVAASRASSLAAAALARDPRLPATVTAARETGQMLLTAARGLPSSRAGIELLVGGVGSGLRQQAELTAAVADRLTVLAQQTAQVSQQIGSLAATAGAMAVREAERDRRALDAQFGLADAITQGARVFEGMLSGVGGQSGDTIRLDPLY